MTHEETLLRQRHNEVYRPLVDNFFTEIGKLNFPNEELAAIPALFLPACGRLYPSSLIKIAVIGQETLRWGWDKDGLAADFRNWRDGRFDGQLSFSAFQNEGPVEWQNRFWQYHFSVLEKIYGRTGLLEDHNAILDGIAWSNRFAVERNGANVGDGAGQIPAPHFWQIRGFAEKAGLSTFDAFRKVFNPDAILYSCRNAAMGSDSVLAPFAELIDKRECDGFKIWTWKMGKTWIFQTWHPSYLSQYKGVSIDAFAEAIREEMIRRKVFAPIGATRHYANTADESSPDVCMAELWDKYLALSPWRYRRCRCWSDLKGKNWMALLMGHPEFAEVCDWSKLSGPNWAELLAKRPGFANQCNKWNDMDGVDWTWLLQNQPRFADKCDWSKLKGCDWWTLLSRRSQFADKCDWAKLPSKWMGRIVVEHPRFLERCDKRKLRLSGLGRLLLVLLRPDEKGNSRKIDFCHWDAIKVVIHMPKFFDRFKMWERLCPCEWGWLLQVRPELADRCDKWDGLDAIEWVNLLEAQPQFADRCAKWDEFSGSLWRQLICKRPSLAAHCDWTKLNGENWASLLRKQPRFADKCDWAKLDENDWFMLLDERPHFARHCPKEVFDYWRKRGYAWKART